MARDFVSCAKLDGIITKHHGSGLTLRQLEIYFDHLESPWTGSDMAAAQKLYPRATVKRIVKAHSKKNLSKNVDVLVSSRTLQDSLICFIIHEQTL